MNHVENTGGAYEIPYVPLLIAFLCICALQLMTNAQAVVNMTATTQKPTEAASLPFLERALKQSLYSPTFLDVKFFVFSRRTYLGDGAMRVDRPQHVLAISSVLKKTDYFEKCSLSQFLRQSFSLTTSASSAFRRI